MCLAARVFWCCRCGGCVRCSIQQPRCRCVSAIFFARVSQHCRDTTKSDRRTPFPEAFIATIRHQKMFAFVTLHSETQSVVTQLCLPKPWNCGRLATATSIFCFIADAFVTRCRLLAIRQNDASNFANWCSWSFCLRRRGVGDNQCFDFAGAAPKVD